MPQEFHSANNVKLSGVFYSFRRLRSDNPGTRGPPGAFYLIIRYLRRRRGDFFTSQTAFELIPTERAPSHNIVFNVPGAGDGPGGRAQAAGAPAAVQRVPGAARGPAAPPSIRRRHHRPSQVRGRVRAPAEQDAPGRVHHEQVRRVRGDGPQH